MVGHQNLPVCTSMVDAVAVGSKSLPTEGETSSAEKQREPAALSATVLPTFAEASALLNSRYSCLVLDTHRRHIALPPKYLGRKKTGIRDQLNTELLRYSEGLNGVPVAYDDIKIVGELGDIYDDQGHVHLNIEAEFVIFRPKAGETLVGVVNKFAPSHIGCLVHGCFNASISKPYKMSMEDWQNLGVKINDQLEFEVFHLDSDAVGVFCIRGKLDFESIKARSSNKLPDEHASTFGNGDQNPTANQRLGNIVENGDNADSETADDIVQLGVHIPSDPSSDVDILPLHKKTKKKKKKHKREDTVINGNNPSGSVDIDKTVRKKKRKHSEDDEISEMSLQPKLKRKKRE